MWKKGVTLIVAVVVGLYLGFPPPPLPDDVISILRRGSFFWYRRTDFDEAFAIFFRDISGDGDQENILLLIHGMPVNSYDWQKILVGLTKKFGRIIVPDLLGTGFSDKPPEYSYTVLDHTNMLEKLLFNLNVGNFHVMAQSVGISIGQELVARSDEQRSGEITSGLSVVSFCMMNGAMFPKLYKPLLVQQIIIQPGLGHLLVRLINRQTFLKNLRNLFGPRGPPEVAYENAAWALFRHKDGNIAYRRWFFYQHERFKMEERWVGAIRDTTIPVHYIFGPSDTINPPHTLEEFKSRVPKATYTVMAKDIGHCPMLEDPEATLQAYGKFLADHQLL